MTTNQAKTLAEKYRQKQEALKTRGSGQDYDKLWVSLEDGKNSLRLFANPTDGGFYVEGGIHRNLNLLGCVDAEGKPAKSALCPTMFDPKNPCPICELLKTFKTSKDVRERGLYDKCRAKERYFSWCRVLTDLSEDALPEGESAQVLGFGSQILGALLSYWTDPDYGDFTDPEEGRTVVIEKSGTGLDTEYTTKLRPKATSYETPDLQPLEETIAPRSYDELEALLGLGGEGKKPPAKGGGKKGGDDDGEDQEERKPSKGQQQRLPLKGKQEREEDEDSGEGEDEEQEERKPSKAPARAPRQAAPAQEAKKGKETAKPECFGEKFQPRAPICVECPVRSECKEVFLST